MTPLLREWLTRYGPGCEGGCGLIEITCPSGPKGGVRPGPGDNAIRLGPKAQKGVGILFWPIQYQYSEI